MRRGRLASAAAFVVHIEPKHILKVMKDKPELFNDLPPIPANVQIGPEYVFKP